MYEGPIQDLIDELNRLPGIGPKSAQRLAFHIVKSQAQDARRLADAVTRAKDRTRFCRECYGVSEGELCRFCSDPSRDPTMVCVVEEPKDVSAVEKAGVVKGRYHVLGGAISPMQGIGPDDLRVQELLDRVQRNGSSRASWPPTRTSRATPRRCTWPVSSSLSACESPGWRRGSRSGVISSPPTRSPWGKPSRAGARCSRVHPGSEVRWDVRRRHRPDPGGGPPGGAGEEGGPWRGGGGLRYGPHHGRAGRHGAS